MSLSYDAKALVATFQAVHAPPVTPRINIHLMAMAEGNEHLLAFMADPVDQPDRFRGKRIAFVATHGAEEVEITIPRKWFQDRGATVDIVSPKPHQFPPQIGAEGPEVANTHILVIQFTTNSGWLRIDRWVEETSPDDYDAIVIPGGAWNPDMLRINDAVVSFVQAFQKTGKPTCAICHGPVVFVNAGLLKGRTVTGYWSIQADLANAGATVVEAPVAVDGNVITGRFIFDIPQFVEALVKQIER